MPIVSWQYIAVSRMSDTALKLSHRDVVSSTLISKVAGNVISTSYLFLPRLLYHSNIALHSPTFILKSLCFDLVYRVRMRAEERISLPCTDASHSQHQHMHYVFCQSSTSYYHPNRPRHDITRLIHLGRPFSNENRKMARHPNGIRL